MEIEYASVKCRKKCVQLANIYNAAVKKGKECKDRNASLYTKIVSFISACDNFEIAMKLASFKTLRGHMLKGDLHGKWAFDMVHPQRFVFDVICEIKQKDGSFDYTKARKICIYNIEDYH